MWQDGIIRSGMIRSRITKLSFVPIKKRRFFTNVFFLCDNDEVFILAMQHDNLTFNTAFCTAKEASHRLLWQLHIIKKKNCVFEVVKCNLLNLSLCF